MALKPAVSIEQLQQMPGALQMLQYSTAKSILSSYSGEFDWLAETIQNAIDSLERRWEFKPVATTPAQWSDGDPYTVLPDDLVPRLRIIIYRNEDRVLVIDNGTGMTLDKFAELVVPFSTDKPPAKERGQKGVGLKYLIYAHNDFSIASKSGGSEEAEPRASGGTMEASMSVLLNEAHSQQMTIDCFGFKSSSPTRDLINDVELPVLTPVKEFPELEFDSSLIPTLANVASGVAVRIGVGKETEHGQLSRRIHSASISRWEHILRTKTAIGNADITHDMKRISNQPTQRSSTMAWLENLQAELFLVEVDSASGGDRSVERKRLDPKFSYPHTLIPASTYQRFGDLINSNSTATFEMLYEYWDRDTFSSEFLAFIDNRISQLDKRNNATDEDPDADHVRGELLKVKQQLAELKPEVYAAYGWHNRFWEERTYRQVTGVDETSVGQRQPDDQRGGRRIGFAQSLRGGIVLAAAGMPMANHLPHEIEIQPQDSDRLFVLIAVDGKLQLDLGRKVPHATEHAAFLRYVDEFIYRHFTQGSRKVLQRNLKHQKGTAQTKGIAEQLASVWEKIRDLENVSAMAVPEALRIIFPRRAYLWPELEVEAVFTAWVTRGFLPGLRMRGIVGYVAPLDLLLEAVPCGATPKDFPMDLLPADPDSPCKNPVWAETKVLLSDLVLELLDERKPGKDLSHIDLVVVRDLDVLALRTRLSQLTTDPDKVLKESDLATEGQLRITLDKNIETEGASGTAVMLTKIDPKKRCFAGSSYLLSDTAGNSAEVIVLEDLVPAISNVIASADA